MSSNILAVLNGWEIVLIFAVILVLFGAKKLPELARGLGHGIKEFKKATRDVTDELQNAMDMDAPPPPPRRLPETSTTPNSGTVAQSGTTQPSSPPPPSEHKA
jgi:sec-independent protein translocase protein TatA